MQPRCDDQKANLESDCRHDFARGVNSNNKIVTTNDNVTVHALSKGVDM